MATCMVIQSCPFCATPGWLLPCRMVFSFVHRRWECRYRDAQIMRFRREEELGASDDACVMVESRLEQAKAKKGRWGRLRSRPGCADSGWNESTKYIPSYRFLCGVMRLAGVHVQRAGWISRGEAELTGSFSARTQAGWCASLFLERWGGKKEKDLDRRAAC